MKQPHEDVGGVDRDDWLLSLDDEALTHQDRLIALAFFLQDACLVGNPAPVVRRMYERIKNPQVGDLVVETSRRRGGNSHMALGILLERRQEWWSTDEDWERSKREDDALTDADRSTDDAWYIQYGSGAHDVCRWTNCMFIMVPAPGENFKVGIGTREGNSVLVNRDDLLSALGDSGFTLRKPTG